MTDKTQQEIEDCLFEAQLAELEGTQYPEASYEQGIEAVINWLYENGPHPIQDA